MMAGVRNITQLRAVFAVLLLLTFAMRLLPAGTMPVVTAQGTLTISLCTPEGVKHMAINVPLADDGDASPSGEPASDHSGDHAPQPDGVAPCAFAMLAAPLLAAAPPLVLAAPPLPLREIALPPPAEQLPATRFAHALPPLRGPPANA